jgi:hypothetical protein
LKEQKDGSGKAKPAKSFLMEKMEFMGSLAQVGQGVLSP